MSNLFFELGKAAAGTVPTTGAFSTLTGAERASLQNDYDAGPLKPPGPAPEKPLIGSWFSAAQQRMHQARSGAYNAQQQRQHMFQRPNQYAPPPAAQPGPAYGPPKLGQPPAGSPPRLPAPPQPTAGKPPRPSAPQQATKMPYIPFF